MTLHVLPDMEQRSPEWYAARCGIVTASVVGKLLTPTLQVADNDTSRGVTASLVAERITGIVEPTYMNDDMFRGVEAEPVARDIYSGHHEQAVEVGFMRLEEPMPWDPNEVARPVDEDAPTWALGFSPDGLVGDDGLIEIKAPRAKGHIATILADEVPAYHMAQCQAGLLVTGRKWIDFISYHGGLPFFVKRVLPDPAWHKAITAACVAFEERAQALIAEYDERVVDMPKTERIDLEVVI